jgi:hypothetical protein
MGGVSSCCHHPLDFDTLHCGPARLSLTLPARNQGDYKSTLVKACRTYTAGDLLEKAYCLVMEPEHLRGSYVEPYLYSLDKVSGRRLMPFGWGLLYGRCPKEAGANVVAEIRVESSPIDGSKHHWLHFRALRSIGEGDSLYVDTPCTLPPVFEAAADKFGDTCHIDMFGRPLEAIGYPEDSPAKTFWDYVNVSYLPDAPPETIYLMKESAAPVRVGHSPIHGMGCFAQRNIAKGEVVELCPNLPIEHATPTGQSVDQGLLGEYTYDYFPGIDMTMLAGASIYNHRNTENISHCKFRGTPFLEAFVADVDIEEGEELFINYGEEYWESRNMEEL